MRFIVKLKQGRIQIQSWILGGHLIHFIVFLLYLLYIFYCFYCIVLHLRSFLKLLFAIGNIAILFLELQLN